MTGSRTYVLFLLELRRRAPNFLLRPTRKEGVTRRRSMSDFRFDPDRNNLNRNDIQIEIPAYMKWIYAGVAGALVLGLVVFAFNNEGTQTASNQTDVTVPVGTTGSGGASRPMPPAQRP
jgi:hypothetical protein